MLLFVNFDILVFVRLVVLLRCCVAVCVFCRSKKTYLTDVCRTSLPSILQIMHRASCSYLRLPINLTERGTKKPPKIDARGAETKQKPREWCIGKRHEGLARRSESLRKTLLSTARAAVCVAATVNGDRLSFQ